MYTIKILLTILSVTSLQEDPHPVINTHKIVNFMYFGERTTQTTVNTIILAMIDNVRRISKNMKEWNKLQHIKNGNRKNTKEKNYYKTSSAQLSQTSG